jgi:hypothetical protein
MIVNFAERAHSHNRELGSSHPILAGYGLLQAPDVAVHLEASPENPGVVRAVQSDLFGASGRHVRDQGEEVRADTDGLESA